MTKIELNILDRATMTAMLAEKEFGSRIDMSLVYNLLKEIDFTPAEVEECEIREVGNGLLYKKDCLIIVNLSDRQAVIVNECLEKADRENRFHLQMVPFWDKFNATFKHIL